MGFDISQVIADPFAVGMLSMASIAWLITFIAAIAADVQDYFPKLSWWGVMFQLTLNVAISIMYVTNTIEYYRLLLVGMTSISFLYSTNSANNLVYSTQSAKLAAAAGCILLSIINLFWLLYFGAEPNSPTSQWIDSFSNRNRAVHQEQLLQQQQQQVNQKMMTESSANPFGYSANQLPYMASSTQLNGLENGEEPAGQGYYSNTTTAINNDLSDDDIEDVDVDGVDGDEAESYPYTVKALYNYDANPADATELSFVKGEILKVQSTNGRWWQAKNVDGKVGILPSNYVEKIDE